jgi:hypothetical protein
VTNVDERRYWVSEEHHPKPREGGIERGRFEWKHLGICLDEPHSLAPLGRTLRERQNPNRQIDSHYCAVRRNSMRKVQYGLTPTTAYVQHALTRLRRKRRQSVPTKGSELQFQRLPDFRPRGEPYVVSGQRRLAADVLHAEIIA